MRPRVSCSTAVVVVVVDSIVTSTPPGIEHATANSFCARPAVTRLLFRPIAPQTFRRPVVVVSLFRTERTPRVNAFSSIVPETFFAGRPFVQAHTRPQVFRGNRVCVSVTGRNESFLSDHFSKPLCLNCLSFVWTY